MLYVTYTYTLVPHSYIMRYPPHINVGSLPIIFFVSYTCADSQESHNVLRNIHKCWFMLYVTHTYMLVPHSYIMRCAPHSNAGIPIDYALCTTYI